MPMCDAYVPAGALPADVEREMLHRISELIVRHELRRTVDLADGVDVDVEGLTERARSIAWLSVLRHEPFVASVPAQAPCYKFVIYVPEGQSDEEFRTSITGDITQAVADAEDGRWPAPESRVWVLSWEVPDGTWGAAGRIVGLGDIVAYVAPELRQPAVERLAARRGDDARALMAAAGVDGFVPQ